MLVKECGETSPRSTVHVLSLTKHVGRHRRAVSLFTRTSYSSSMGGLCTGPDIDIEHRHRHLCRVGRLGGMVKIMGHVNGSSKMRVLKPVYMKGQVSKKVHVVCIVPLGLAQENIP